MLGTDLGGHRTGQLGWEQGHSQAGTQGGAFPILGTPRPRDSRNPTLGLSPWAGSTWVGWWPWRTHAGHPQGVPESPQQPALVQAHLSSHQLHSGMFSRPHNLSRAEQRPPQSHPVPSQHHPWGTQGIPEGFFHQLSPLEGKHGGPKPPSSGTLVDICKPRSHLHFWKQNLPNLQLPPNSRAASGLQCSPSGEHRTAQIPQNPSLGRGKQGWAPGREGGNRSCIPSRI